MQADDFRRALAQAPRARSEHFAVHAPPARRPAGSVAHHAAGNLSTPVITATSVPVEDHPRLGLVLPKRLARHAVTRNLLRRQGRAVWAASAAARTAGDWVIRLSRPFDRAHYPSAASPALRSAVRAELQALLAKACDPERQR